MALLSLACQARERASGPLPQEAYVWQRAWTPAVREAVGQTSDFAILVVLAAEVDLSQAPPRISRAGIDWPTLREAGRPVGLALRIGRFQGWGGGTGKFAEDPQTVRLLASLAAEMAAQADSQGIDLREIQLDYDCPESKLADYPVLIEEVRRSVAPTPVTITALPSWLRHQRAFRNLSRKADGVVLQVHSLRAPSKPGERIPLVDPEDAVRAVEKAARAGRPFRVALPTYAYGAVFDPRGNVVGLAAEGTGGAPNASDTAADPEAMAGLVRGWTADRPRELSGLIWYRLPTSADTRNWPRTTLNAVMAGRAPRREIRTSLRRPDPALVEIDLVNSGEAEVLLPSPVHIRWDSDNLIVADGLTGYRLLRAGPREIRMEGPDPIRSLRPGERRTIAWLRFRGPAEVHVEIPSSL